MFKDKQLTPRTSMGEHSHDVISLSLTLGGSYTEEFEEDVQTCRPLDLQLKPARIPHTTRSSRGAHLFIVHLPEMIESRGAGLARSLHWSPGISSALALACRQARPADPGKSTAPRARQLLQELLARLTREVNRSADGLPPWIQVVERELHSRLSPPPSLPELGRQAGVHPVYLARVFRRWFGCSVGDHVRSLRIETGVRWLLEGDLAPTDIALQLGYYDQSHFGRDFRRETGWSPARFRQTARSLRGDLGGPSGSLD